MAFQNNGTMSPYGAPVKLFRILGNSATFTINDSLKLVSGFLVAGTTGALVFGHLQGIGTLKGMPMNSTGAAGADFGSFINAFTTASDNQTVAMFKGECDVSKFTMYSASLDATVGTTTGSNLPGYNMDIASAVTLSESSATATTTASTTAGQYAGHGLDPVNSARVLVNIFESQVAGI